MTYLPDVNVWVALAIAEHTHHRKALSWLESAGTELIRFCRVTEMGLLRLLTNPRVLANSVLTPDGAWKVLLQFLRDDRIGFAAEPPGLRQAWRQLTRTHDTGTNFWTDTYLAAFAEVSGYTVVTFDRGFARYPQVSSRILR